MELTQASQAGKQVRVFSSLTMHIWSTRPWSMPCNPLLHVEQHRGKAQSSPDLHPSPQKWGDPTFPSPSPAGRDGDGTQHHTMHPTGKGPCEQPGSGVSHRIGDWPSPCPTLPPRGTDLRQNRCLTHANMGAAGLALLFPSVFLKMPL